MHFVPDVSLGSVFTTISFLVAAAFAWRDLNWRVKNLEVWKESHLHTAEQALQNISMLQQAIAAIKQLAAGQERRIEMLEDFQQNQQNWRRQQ